MCDLLPDGIYEDGSFCRRSEDMVHGIDGVDYFIMSVNVFYFY